MSFHRNRTWYFAATVAVIAVGLASRRWPVLPGLLGKYPGDVLWAAMVYLGWGVLLPKASPRRIALLASAICVSIECLKLWQAPWLVSLRHTTIGHLVFGHVFSWSNFPAYALGILAVFLIETSTVVSGRLTRSAVAKPMADKRREEAKNSQSGEAGF